MRRPTKDNADNKQKPHESSPIKYVWEDVWSTDPYNRPEERRARARRRLGEIEHYLSVRPELGNVVEFGCGDGSFAHCLSHSSAVEFSNYTGYDLSSTALRRARESISSARFQFIREDISKLVLPVHSIDTAFMLGVLEHLPRPECFLASVRDALRPNGRIVLTTSNTLSLMYLQRRMRESINKWPYGYQRNYTPMEFQRMVASYFGEHVLTTMQGDWDFPLTALLDRAAYFINRKFGRYILFVGQPRMN